ncbi:MAG: glycosyltransferase family 2 protein [Bacteroidales bacterium]|nr:glycosyltransferase family 2 protein [Bacteroidales bacterium]
MNSKPKISVIVPVYKAEKYLHKCVDSLLAQTFTDFEILLIDDGSPDKSGEICDEYALKDNRIRVFHKENGGVTSARRFGVEKSSGAYIFFSDSDDYVPSTALLKMVDHINDNIDIIIGAWEKELHGKRRIIPLMTNGIKKPRDIIKAFLLEKCYCGPVGKLYSKKLFDGNTFDIPSSIIINEDLIMNINLVKKSNLIKCLPYTIVYRYIQHEESVSHTKILENDWTNTFSEIKKLLPTDLFPYLEFYINNIIYKYPEIKKIINTESMSNRRRKSIVGQIKKGLHFILYVLKIIH